MFQVPGYLLCRNTPIFQVRPDTLFHFLVKILKGLHFNEKILSIKVIH